MIATEEKCKCGGCGKNRLPNRITVTLEDKEVSNRELECRRCTYKKRGDTSSCLRYEQKPAEVLAGGKCEFFLKDSCEIGSACKNCGECK